MTKTNETNSVHDDHHDVAKQLEILQSIEESLAQRLEIEQIYELVGEKLQSHFDATTVILASYNADSETVHYPFVVSDGERHSIDPHPLSKSFSGQVIKTKEALLLTSADQVLEWSAKLEAAGEGEGAKSFLGVPLILEDEVIGMISLQNVRREGAFSQDDLQLLTTLANSMSVALENARLLQEMEERNAELAVINSVQDGLVSKLDIRSIFELVGNRISEIFAGHAVALYTYDAGTDMVEAMFMLERGVRHHPPPIQPGAIGRRILETKKPLVISSLAEFKAIGAQTVEGTEASQSGIYAPLVVNDDVIGALNIESPDKEHAFTESDLRLVTTIANSMSVALENARLFDETQRLLEETEERNAELAMINTVQQGLVAELNMQAIYDLVGDKLCQIFDAQAIVIATLDPESGLEHFYYVYEKDKRFYPKPRPFDGVRKDLLQNRKPIYYNQITEEAMAQSDS
ncbi:MAG: GAF domain-containing protein, partial [Anaerolineales bacterium]